MADTEIIPVIDLGPYLAGEPGALDRTAEELRFALTEIGFYFIVNHGVPSELIHEVFRQVARFHAQPLDKKLEIKLDKHNVGYLPMKGDTLRTSTVETVTKPNLNEAFFVARDLPPDHPDVLADRRFRSANRWPADLPGFREIVVDYCDTMERLVQKLVRLYARALDLPAAYFDEPFNDLQYKLRMTHYPHQAGARTTSSASRRTPTPVSSRCSRPTTCPVSRSAPKAASGSTPRPSPTPMSSTAASCCSAGPTTISSPRRTARSTAPAASATRWPFSATATSTGRSPPCRPASGRTSRRNTRRPTTPTT